MSEVHDIPTEASTPTLVKKAWWAWKCTSLDVHHYDYRLAWNLRDSPSLSLEEVRDVFRYVARDTGQDWSVAYGDAWYCIEGDNQEEGDSYHAWLVASSVPDDDPHPQFEAQRVPCLYDGFLAALEMLLQRYPEVVK